ncbi:MAG: transcription antitermination factor NusB [Desulfovibrionaceae bacterium]|nr:transcription antitermination factor NusB [Desulfovibrionaceae bacterium]
MQNIQSDCDRRPRPLARGRRAARGYAFQVLYSIGFSSPDNLEELRSIFCNAKTIKDASLIDGEPAPQQARPEGFAWKLVYGVWSEAGELDRLISGFSEGWKLERLGRVELTLLRMGLYELMFNRETPEKVIISEALELARQYADQKALAFINGILDSAAKSLRAG